MRNLNYRICVFCIYKRKRDAKSFTKTVKYFLIRVFILLINEKKELIIFNRPYLIFLKHQNQQTDYII